MKKEMLIEYYNGTQFLNKLSSLFEIYQMKYSIAFKDVNLEKEFRFRQLAYYRDAMDGIKALRLSFGRRKIKDSSF